MNTRIPVVAGLGAVTALALHEAVVLPAIRRWGATAEEARAELPGDELVPDAPTMSTRAVTVEAPADAVWRWLVQIGVGRGGWYSYDLLERAFGVPVHNTDEVREEWQALSVGDRVVLAPAGWMGLAQGYAMPVARIDPGRSLVLRQQPPEHPWDGVWSFHIRPIDDQCCRLLARSRTAGAQGPARIGAAIGSAVGDPVTFVMERRMLLGIKERAEEEVALDEGEKLVNTIDVLLPV